MMFAFGTLFTLPNATDMLSGIGAYSNPIFTEFFGNFFYPVVGIILPIIVVIWLIGKLIGH